MSLQTELEMRKPFDDPPHEAVLSIYYTASKLRKSATEFFRSYGLTDVQYNVLSLLKHQSGDSGGLTQVELSRMMLVNRANITTLIDRMEKSDLVVREPVPDDRRYNVVKLTEHGSEMYHSVSGRYGENFRKLMSILSDEELDMLISSLQKIREHQNYLESESA